MNKEHLHILQHSLGVDEYGNGTQYRNHFVTSPGSVDWPVCMDLAGQGLMTWRESNLLGNDQKAFMVSRAGKEAVAIYSDKPPKLSRGQQRYREYLDSDGAFDNFGHFLKSRCVSKNK